MRDNDKILFTTSTSQNMLKMVLFRGVTILLSDKYSVKIINVLIWN